MFTELLVPLDGSPLAEAAIPHAVELARRLRGGLHLVRVHVPFTMVASPPETAFFVPDPSWDMEVRENARRWLARKAQDIRSSAEIPVSFDVRTGAPVQEIAAAAAERDVRAIVCSTHGHGGWAPEWIGSVADGLIRRAGCPVFAMSKAAAAHPEGVRRLLVLLDGSDVSETVLPHAVWLAGAFRAQVELLRVVAPPWIGDSLTMLSADQEDPFGVNASAEAAKDTLRQIATALGRKGFTATSTVLIDASPARAILEHMRRTQPDAVALASHGRGLSRLFLGSVADKVLRAGGVPALVFRPHAPAQAEPSGLAIAADERVMATSPA